MNELVVSRCSSDPASDKFDYLRKNEAEVI